MIGPSRYIQAAIVTCDAIESIDADAGTLTYPFPSTASAPPSGPSATQAAAGSRSASAPSLRHPDESRAVALPAASSSLQKPIRSSSNPGAHAAGSPSGHG